MTSLDPFRLLVRPFDHADVATLLVEIQQFYVDVYGGRDDDATPAEAFSPPLGLFLVGYRGDVPVATGGWRRLDGETVEIKRMWVSAAERGRGLSRTVLAELERTAAEAGARVIRLNTGFRQPTALALYDASGYQRTDERYGHYRDEPGAQFFVKHL